MGATHVPQLAPIYTRRNGTTTCMSLVVIDIIKMTTAAMIIGTTISTAEGTGTDVFGR